MKMRILESDLVTSKKTLECYELWNLFIFLRINIIYHILKV